MRKLITLVLVVFIGLCTKAQTIKTVGAGGNYTTLQSAFTAINSGSITGSITLKIISNTTETATCLLNASGTGSTNYSSLLIYPTISGIIVSGSITGPLIDLNGADNVTIDGRVNATGTLKDLTITNSNTGTSSSTIRFINSASSNTLKYSTIKGSSMNPGGGMIHFSSASSGTGNSGNTIDNNNITSDAAGRPLFTIYLYGTSGYENSGNVISNNNIYDFLNKNAASYGIYCSSNSTALSIIGNSFYETTTFIPTSSVEYDIIKINNTAGNNFNITGNYIGGNAALCGGYAWTKTNAFDNIFNAIILNAGTITASNIHNNTIKNFVWSNSASASWTGINIGAGLLNIGTTQGNVIGGNIGTSSITVTGGTTGENIYGIYISSSGTTDCENNMIGSITVANLNQANSSNAYGIYKSAVTGLTTISNNTIGSSSTLNSINSTSASTANAQIVAGIFSSGSNAITINNNIIANLNNSSTNSDVTSTGFINGIASTSGTNIISNNIIHDLTIANANNTSTNTASVCGLCFQGNYQKTVSGNQIYNLSNTNSSFTGSVIGIYYTSNTGSNTATNNFIYNLSVASSTTAAIIYGIKINLSSATFANNIVNLGGNTAATIYGIYEPGISGYNINMYFNTVYIGGNPSSGSINQSYCLYSNSVSNLRNFRNNIFDNARSTIGGLSLHYAAYFNYGANNLLTLDNNDYYASGTGGVIGYYNSNDVISLPIISGLDINSLSVSPGFSNGGGNVAANFIPSNNQLAGIKISNFLTDYSGNIRAGSPTIGALEGNIVFNLGVYSNGTLQASYVHLKEAFDNINNGIHTGALEIRINGSTTETTQSILYQSGYTSASGTSNYSSITIYPTASGLSISGNIASPIIYLWGAKNVTIDGRVNKVGTISNLSIVNTNTGFSASVIRYINSAENNTLRYCNISGSAYNAGTGIIYFTTSVSGNGNNNNVIEYCNITKASENRPINAIFSSGTTGLENKYNIIRNNNIYNVFNPSSNSYVINISYASSDWTISNNSFYETNALVPTGAFKYYSIFVNTGNNHLVNNNYIGGSSQECGGTAMNINASFAHYFTGIFINGGIDYKSVIENNIIRNINYTSTNSNPWDGIYINSGNVNVHKNIIGAPIGTNSIIVTTPVASASVTVSGSVVTGITLNGGGSGYTVPPVITFSTQGTSPTTPAIATATINNGSVSGFTLTDGGSGYTFTPSVLFDGSTYSVSHGIRNFSTGTVNIDSNTIGSVTTVGSKTYSHCFESIILNNLASTVNITNNLVGSLVTPNSILVSSTAESSLSKEDVFGIYSMSSGTTVINNNTVANLTNAYSGNNSGTRVRGISTTYGSNIITNNIVRDIKCSSGQSTVGSNASLIGINQSSTSSGLSQIMSGNTVYNLTNLNASAKVELYGIYNYGPSDAISTVSGNFVNNLFLTNNNITSVIDGINLSNGITTCSNNIITLGNGNSTGYLINGIFDNSGATNNNNIYFNSVYVGGNVSSVTTGNTSALNDAANTSTRDYKNNILVNSRSGGLTGKHYSVILSGNSNLTNNYNDYFAPNGILGKFGNADKITLALLQSSTTQDIYSLNTDPLFSNAGGNSAINFYSSAILPGVTGTGINSDYQGSARGTTPEMGAFSSICLSGTAIAIGTTLCSGSSTTVTLSGYTGNVQWQQSLDGSTNWINVIGGNGATTATYITANLTSSIYFRAQVNNGVCAPVNSNVISITINDHPLQPGAITASLSTVCPNQTGVSFSIMQVNQVGGLINSYTWTLPTGTILTSGQGTTAITINFGNNSGNVSVTAYNTCGNSLASTLAINFPNVPSPPSNFAVVSSDQCTNDQAIYSVTGDVNATGYTWSFSDNAIITSGIGSNSVTVSLGTYTGNIYVSITSDYGCGSSNPLVSSHISQHTVPGIAGDITGPVNVCSGQSGVVYSISSVADATSYNWTAPGATITGGNGTTSITVTFSTSSVNLAVTTHNLCGDGSSQHKSITIDHAPAMPASITGPTPVCTTASSNDYGVTQVQGSGGLGVASIYTWSGIPSGATFTGQNYTDIIISYNSSPGIYTLSVTANNICGSSSAQTLPVTVHTVPPQPAFITGNSSVCYNDIKFFSATTTDITSYYWTVINDANVTAGQNSSAITVAFGNNSGNIIVTPSNVCGDGISKTLAVTMNAPTSISLNLQNVVVQALNTANFSISTLGSNLSYKWQVNTGSGFTTISTNSTYNITNHSDAGSDLYIHNSSTGISGYTYRCLISGSCGSLTSSTGILTVTPSCNAVTILTQPLSSTKCVGDVQLFTVEPNPSSTTPFSFTWKKNGATISGATDNTYSINPVAVGNAGMYSVSISNCGATVTSSAATLTVNDVPTLSGSITGNSSICINKTGVSFSISGTGTASSYIWVLPIGASITSGANTTAITINCSTVTDDINVSGINLCGKGNQLTKTITVKSSPSIPAGISGSTNICTNTTSIYYISSVSGATGYNWSVPTGATLTSNAGTSITVSFDTYTGSIGNIGVSASNACGTSDIQTLAITAETIPNIPGSIAGINNVCANTAGVIYQIGNVSGATGYTWGFPSDITSIMGQGTNRVTITFGGSSGNMSVTGDNACGSSQSRSSFITVQSQPPAEPSAISGKMSVCSGTAGVLYSTSEIFGSTIYTWTVPTGAIITSGSGTDSITVTLGSASGNISVSTGNVCGNSGIFSQPVNVIGEFSITSGNDSPKCEGVSVVLTSTGVSGVTYLWEGPNDFYSVDQNPIINNINIHTEGKYKVTANNGCVSATDSTYISVIPAFQITASNDGPACLNTNVKLSSTAIPGATYLWYGPNGFYTQEANPVINNVNILNNGTYQVTANLNGCTSTTMTTNVVVNDAPYNVPFVNIIPVDTIVCAGNSFTFTANAASASSFSYQWYKNNEQLAMKNNQLLALNNISEAETGDYYCVVTNACASAKSNIAGLTVNTLPSISITPLNSSQCQGTSITFKANVTGTTPYSYQWLTEIFPIKGATTSSYTINGLQSSNSNEYHCNVSNLCGSTTSLAATLTINNFEIITQPFNAYTHAGGNVIFLVASNDSNSSYQWQKNGVTINDNSLYSGTQSPQLSISNCPYSFNNYTYRCIVTGLSCGVKLISNSAALTVSQVSTAGLWRGIKSDHWDDNNNWDIGTLPDANTDVIVPSGSTNMPVVYSSVNASCHNITLNAGSSLLVRKGGDLNISGKFHVLSDNTGQGAFMDENNSQTSLQDSITIEKYISNAGFHYISNPINGATINQINKVIPLVNLYGQYYSEKSAYSNIWKLDETHSNPKNSTDLAAWLAPSGLNEVMQNARGYALVVPKSNTMLKISGPANTQNNGDISYNLTNKGNGFNFIGNPYPSPIDWDCASANLSEHISGTIIFFYPNSLYYGAWGYYNPLFGSYGPFPHNQYIPVMQGFYLHVDSSAVITFTNACRTVAKEAIQTKFFKSAAKRAIKYPFLKLSASNTNTPDTKDETIIWFNTDAGDKYNSKFDCKKLLNTITEIPNIFIISDTSSMSLKAFKGINDSLSVPISCRVNETGKYTINASEMQNFSEDISVYIVDSKEGIQQNLNENPAYTTKINAEETNGRFYIKFRKVITTDNSNSINTSKSNYKFKIYPNPSDGLNINLEIKRK